MKKLLLAIALTFSTIGTASLSALDATQEQQARTSAKLQRLDLLISAENNLFEATTAYININGKYNTLASTLGGGGAITDATLTALGLPISDNYKTSPFSLSPISMTITDTEINIKNVLTTNSTNADEEFLKSYYQQKRLGKSLGYVTFALVGTTSSSNWKILMPTSSKMIMSVYQKSVDIVPTSNVKFSQIAPTDTTKIWAKSSREGSIEYFYYLNGAWNSYGNTYFDSKDGTSSTSQNCLTGIPDDVTLQNIKGINGMCALIPTADSIQKWWYVESEQKWVGEGSISSGDGGGTFTGSATLKEVACSIFSKSGGSIAEVSPIINEYLSLSSTVEFIKFDNLTTGGYWKQNSATPAFVVFKDIAGAIAHKATFSTGTKAYICKDGGDVYEMQKTVFNKWAYIGYNFSKTATFFQNAPLDDGGYILSWDTVSARSDAHKKYFQAVGSGTTLHYASKYNFDNTIVNTSDITQNIKLSPASRTNFGTGAYNTWYLSANDDCPTKLNCNGATTATYAGTSPSTYDGMYSWYYSPLGIIDAQPFSTLALAYASTANPQAVIVGSNVYTRGLDSNSKECYKNVSNNVFYTGGAVAFPTVMVVSGVVQMPTTKTCETATFTSGTYLNLDSWVEVTDWTSAPIYSYAVAGGKYWRKQATGVSGRWLSTDNLVQMTKGSRTNLANPNGTTLTNISRVVGTEPRYTPSGVTYTANTSFLQWFYSTTGTITNYMLDAVSCSWTNCYTNTTAKSAGVGMNTDGTLIKYNGTYWSQSSNSSNYLMKYMNQYNTDTVLVNYAVGKSASGLWYDNGTLLLKATSIASINNPCLAKGMRAPTLYETYYSTTTTSNVPNTSGNWNWTVTPKDSGAYLWKSGTFSYTSNWGYGLSAYVRCVK